MADKEPPGRFASWFGPVVWVLLVVLAVQLWMWTSRSLRAEADQGFAQRTQVAAGSIGTYLSQLTAETQQDASNLLAGPTVTQQQFTLFSGGTGFASTVLLDGQGRLLLIHPPAPALIGADLTKTLEHVRLAVRHNRTVVSNVYISLAFHRPIVAIAVPFTTPYGRRLFSGGFFPETAPLNGFLTQDRAGAAGGHAYLVDRAGNLVAATTPLGPQITPLSGPDPDLARALRRQPHGAYRTAGHAWRYTSANVRGTGWRLVTTTPQRVLYTQVNDTQRHLTAVLSGAALLGLAATVIITVIMRSRRRAEQRLRALNTQYARQAAQLQELNTDLQASNTELEAFSYSVAHDLRAPLRAMTGYAEILIEDHHTIDAPDRISDQEATRLLDRIRTNATTMAQLIDALLSFSQLQRQPLHTQTVDVTALTRATWNALAGHRAGRDIAFDLADLPPCQGDPNLLRQVLTNLLDNAIKFTRDQPAAGVEVGAHPGPEGFTTYYVKDNGVGFDPAHAGHLFEPFHRLHPPGTYQGLGIGLSLARRIITRHGGRITAESTPGQGATFSFTLPTT